VSKRLALGTVQFGLRYGIANRLGQVGRKETATILMHARAAGVDTLDTAIAYGNSEQRLGEIGVGEWQVISKLPAIPVCCTDVTGWVRDSVLGSLDRLRVPRLHGLLLHRSQELRESHGEALRRGLVAMKDAGLVDKIGVSIYAPEELDAVEACMHPDLVQVPFSVIDRRIARSGWLARLHRAGTQIYARSVFLQGLLLMEPMARPARFNRWQRLLGQWDEWLHDQALNPLQVCLSFVLSQPEIDRVVVGVDSLEQLQGILASVDAPPVVAPIDLMSEDLDLVNPSRWSTN
jgi:hypothetical protein